MEELTRSDQSADIETRVRRTMARSLLIARWIMAPIYIGLLGGLLLVAIKFLQKLIGSAPRILAMDSNETILVVLTLVDLSLVANLVVIVMLYGWENFVGPLVAGTAGRDLTGLDFTAVKLKLIGSIAAIAAIQILETFVHIGDTAKSDAMWELLILLGIGLTGVLLALMDRLGGDAH